ncbi:hypothetical protein BCR42DRAFT_450906 [Absidia repens]|uniref:F-box domain-containing protein n=1 Tax=Absidia repens TaxID=90262 RepID=A0A1X2IIJ2_9FUNG|nr:hypothetical protein BCR42DRAFT_450906 [Absidia repens]
MGSSPMSISSIQLSSPLPSPSATPNRQNQDATQQGNGHFPSQQHSSSQPSQQLNSLNTLFLPPLVFDSTQHSSSPSTSSSIYPLADTPTPPELKRIKFTLNNRPALLEEIDPSDTLLQHQQHQQHHTYSQNNEPLTSQPTLLTVKSEDLPPNDETSQRKRPASTQLESVRTILSPSYDLWSYRQKQYCDNLNATATTTTMDTTTTSLGVTTTTELDNNGLTLETNYHINTPADPVAAITATVSTANDASTTSSSSQSLVSLLPEFATHLPSTDTMEATTTTAMADSPSSALPSPISDIDPNDEAWPSSPRRLEHQSTAMDDSTAVGADIITEPANTTTSTTTAMMDIVHDDDSSMEDMVDGGLSSLLRTYDILPTDIQNYLMFQLLRRSSMPSLRFASDMIMQALKLDFIARLPRRLSRQILLYLDVRSLCRASGVSRLWKYAIEQDADLWRAKIVEAGFTVTAAEIERYGLTSAHLYQQFPHQQHHFYTSHPYSQQLEHLHQRTLQQQQQQRYHLNDLGAPSSSSSSSSLSMKTGMATSPYLSPIKKLKHESSDASFLNQSPYDYPLSYAPADPTQLHRTELSAPNFDTMDDDAYIGYDNNYTDSNDVHPFKRIYKNHHKVRQNWKHNRVKRQQVKGHGEVVTCLQFDDDKIITGFDDNYINVHDIKTGMLRRVLRGHEGGVWALQYVGNTLVTGSTDRTLRVWDIENGICRFVFRGHTSTVRCLHIVMPTPVVNDDGATVIQPSHPLIVSGSRDMTLRVWKLPYLPGRSQPQSQNQQASHHHYHHHLHHHHHHHRHQQRHSQEVKQEHQQQNSSIFGFDAQYRQPKDTMMDEDPSTAAMAPPPSTSTASSSSSSSLSQQPQNNLLFFFNGLQSNSFQPPQQQQQQQQDQQPKHHNQHQQPHEHDFNPFFVHLLEGHKDSVRALAAHGNTLASGSYDSTVRLWDLETGLLKHQLEGHTQKVYSVAIDAQRQRCISGSMDSSIRVFNMIDGTCERVLRGHTILVGLLGLTKNYLVSAAADSTLRVWTADSDDCHHILSGHKGAITTFQHDDHKVISGSEGGLKMWDIKTGELVRDLITDVNGIWRVAFDERRCVAAVKSENTTRLEILDYGTDTEDD